ncbi:von Willebrand factor-like isoform X3 [Octopus sinensis]|uniref:von Willebrand factor-like isoform X3 n=1 Tax=Octopus sinensis TaxID=2607531 RepID=A0A7E6EQR2_9MOLL|nr:von Willebrand factor-like isoform X3 [Octopus sinensis]
MKLSVIAAFAALLALCLIAAGEPLSRKIIKKPDIFPIKPGKIKSCDKAVADVMLVLDDSGSVGSTNFKKVKRFAQNIVKSFNIGRNKIRVGAITFSGKVKLQFKMNKYYNKRRLLRAISRIKYKHGSTNTNRALDYLRTRSFRRGAGDRKGVPNIAIVLTDGKANSLSKTKIAALKLRKTGAIVFAIGVGKGIKRSELNVIGSSPRRNYVFSVRNFNALMSIAKQLIKRTCNVPVLPVPITTVKGCDKAVADVMLVLDDSSSVGSTNFKKVKRFAQYIVNSFNIGRNKIRVGAITFSGKVKLQFKMNKYYNKRSLLRAISRIKYKHGGTNTNRALDYLRTQSFRRGAGDRKGVPNIAIVLTDGKSFSLRKTKIAALKLRKTGAIVFAIGVGRGIKRSELNVIGSSPRRNYVFSVRNFNALRSIAKQLIKRTCNVPVLPVTIPARPCVCSASGDPHYKTFDGQMIHFMGTCKYTLVTPHQGSNYPHFKVEVKNEHRGRNKRVSYTRLVDVKLGNNTLRLLPRRRITVNGVRFQMPINNYLGFTVKYAAGWVRAETAFGLLVKFDGNHRVIVKVPGTYRRELTGICGDCNGKKDDWRTKAGVNVSKRRNKYSLIGKSYEVPDDSDKPQKKCQTTDVGVTCKNRVIRRCKEIIKKGGIFKKCLKSIFSTAVKFYQSCKIDVCAYNKDKKLKKEVLCRSFEAFAQNCENIGVLVNWRKALKCKLKCPKNMVYKFSTPIYQPSCSNRRIPRIRKFTEGCVCKKGFILSGTECVPSTRCGCKYKGLYMKRGSSFLLDDCSRKISCRNNGRLRISRPCHKYSVCQVVNGDRVCKCKKGHVIKRGKCVAPAPITTTTAKGCEKAVADVMLVLDDSGSVGSKNFAKVKTFAQNIVKSFNIGRNKIRVGAITFSHKVKLQFRLNRYYNKKNVLKAINRIKYKHGSTNTHKALDYLRRLSFRRIAGDRKLVPNIAIVLTDGKSNNLSKTKSAALKLRKTGAIVFAIGVGKGIKRSELNVIGSSPRRNHVFSVKGFNVLNSIVKRLTKRTCNVHPCDAKPCKNGGVCRRRGQTYKCSCRRGFVGRQCTIVSFQAPAPLTSLCQCRAVGDPHYRTFDGQMIHFMGSCKYTLASTINGTRLSNFNVEVKNEHRGYKRVSYTRLVDIKINGVTLRLYPKHRIAVNNELLEMPLIKYMGFTVVNTGGWVIATTTFGLLVKFDGNHRVIVQVPSYYKGQLTGICGDCNGRKDDWRTKTGVDVTRKRSKYSLIGKSYAVIDDSDKPSKKCEVTDPSTTCSKSVTKVCDYMKNFNGVFKRCIIKLGIKVVQQYIQSCKIDACAYKTVSKTLKEVTCRAYEGLVRQCEDAGVLVNWRGVLGCRLDCSRGKNMMYKVKIAANQPTCFNRNPPAISYYSDGCVCKPNYILSGNECVPKSKCGCMYKGMYIKAHTSVLLNDCSRSITCLSNGKYTTKSTCPKDSSCLVEFGRRTCKCASGFAPVGKECKKTSVPPPSIINPAFLKPVLHRFFRVTVAYIVGKPLEESTEKHVEQCAHKCLKNKKCKSFNFDELEKKCQLYDISAATVTLKPSECPYKEYFQLIESRNVLIKGATIVTCVHLDEFSKINSEEKCKAKCSEKKCKAMEYSRFFKQCGVTHKGLTTYGLVGNMFWKFSVTLDTLPGVAY